MAYPETILRKALWKARKTHFRGPKPIISELDDDDYSDRVIGNIVVPYVPTLEKFKRPLRNLKYGLIFQYKNKLSTCLTKNSPGALETGVYKIPCKVCPKLYIGETGRSIPERMSGHKNDVKKLDPNLASGVVNHSLETGHRFDFEGAQMVYRSNNLYKRHIVESAVITHFNQFDQTVNLNRGFSPHNDMLSKIIFDLIPCDDKT